MVEQLLKLLAYFIIEINPDQTFKVVGKITDLEVRILINSGVSHNFILEELVKKANLPM